MSSRDPDDEVETWAFSSCNFILDDACVESSVGTYRKLALIHCFRRFYPRSSARYIPWRRSMNRLVKFASFTTRLDGLKCGNF